MRNLSLKEEGDNPVCSDTTVLNRVLPEQSARRRGTPGSTHSVAVLLCDAQPFVAILHQRKCVCVW